MTEKPRKVGGNAGKGRKKGTPNKVTASVKEAFLLAHQGIGGSRALTEWARDNQTEFYKLLSRLIPTEVTGADGGPIEVRSVVILPPITSE